MGMMNRNAPGVLALAAVWAIAGCKTAHTQVRPERASVAPGSQAPLAEAPPPAPADPDIPTPQVEVEHESEPSVVMPGPSGELAERFAEGVKAFHSGDFKAARKAF